VATAEPFHFQATDLGSYLLFDSDEKFLAASEGVVGQAGTAVTESQPGAMAGGVALEQSDRAAEEAARSDANVGRGDSVVAADAPSELADWTVTEITRGEFSFTLPVLGRALGVGSTGDLTTIDNTDSGFRPRLTSGCAEFPEIEVNIDGPVTGGESEFQEVRGFLDAHLHMMAFEFLGGRARCGRPWHPYGVTYALVDCPDHEPGGQGAVLEQILSKHEGEGHNTDGWPTFEGWPKHYSLTHEQVYYKWLERAWRGGLRMFVNLLVDNNQLCKIYPFKRNSCNEMDGVRLQAKRIRELERYIDAQNGGPGEGWFRIVKDPFEARQVINEGKLAVVLGIEVSVPLDCGLLLDSPQCDLTDVEKGLDEVYDLGVRQMELVNKFDNAFSGVAGDSGTTGVVVNQGNKGETGEYWNMETCDESEGHAHDNTQMNLHDDGGMPDEFTGRDALAGGILALNGALGVLPIYPQGPHCNVLELSDLGEAMIRGMADRGMIFDPDHMSARAQTQALDLVESLGYSGIVSSHGWSNDTIYPRIYKLGGVITPYAGGSAGFVHNYFHTKAWADDRYYFGFGYGSDVNGFGSQGGPRSGNESNPVTYPFTGFGGVTVNQQQSGTYTYDINSDGVSHYGLYPDWIEDLRRQAGDGIIADMARGPEAYLQMWERAIGIAPDSCRSDVEDLADAQLGQIAVGMSSRDVLSTLGQPSERTATSFRYCLSGFREATVTFDDNGGVADWEVSSL
jgi:microsomal dipeptidase-like Zn-dependent dipeptidase